MTGIFHKASVKVCPPLGGDPQLAGRHPAPPWQADHTLPLRRVYQDDDLMVIDKPAGLLVHRTALDAHETDTVMSRLWRELGARAPAGLTPVHRLDKGTSGLLVLACHASAARRLGQSFEQAQAHKRYLALVRGWPQPITEVDHALARDPEQPSAGQPTLPAHTRVTRLNRVAWPFSVDGRHADSRYALVLAEPRQGRRHQIRRHLKHMAHPILGDATHGKGTHNRQVAAWLGLQRLWLHAWTLSLPHPDGQRRLELCAPPGPPWHHLLQTGTWLDPMDPAALTSATPRFDSLIGPA
jgi:tRNA pseudouridine65 synthase